MLASRADSQCARTTNTESNVHSVGFSAATVSKVRFAEVIAADNSSERDSGEWDQFIGGCGGLRTRLDMMGEGEKQVAVSTSYEGCVLDNAMRKKQERGSGIL